MLYVNFEDERLLPFATSDFNVLLEVFYSLFPDSAREECWFFFDEIQRIPGWDMFLRRLLDERRLRLMVTGSSAKLLSREIATSLRGRALTTELFPFSFGEVLSARGIGIPSNGLFPTAARGELNKACADYLGTGGFPEVVDSPANLRREILRGYVDVVILRDVVERHGVSNVSALRALVRHVLHSPGTRFSVNRFGGQMRSMGIPVAKNALYEFVDHLSDAYLMFPVEIYARSIRKRQVNPRKMYSVDTGLLRAMSLDITADRGALLENLVFLALRRRGIQPDYYVTAHGGEVDFAYRDARGRLQLLQVCWSLETADTRERELRALREALAENPGAEAAVVTWMDEADHDGLPCLPAWKWLLRMETPSATD
jgi:hypothetical protein